MIRYRSVEVLEVLCGDVLAGFLRRLPKGCDFAYTSSYLASSAPPVAYCLPKRAEPYVLEGLANLPAYVAGLLPEGVMFEAVRRGIGASQGDLFSILAATGFDAIGDVVVRVQGETVTPRPELDLEVAADIVASLPSSGGRLEAISAIPGVQPKLSIGGIVRLSRRARFIAKFESPDFPGLCKNEASCMRLARRCGIPVPIAEHRNGAYVVERFDRAQSGNSGKMQKLHVEDVLQLTDRFPHAKYTLDFVEVGEVLVRLGVGLADLARLIQLYAFSYMIGNGDLHEKNVSAIRRSTGQWVLAPGYDLLSTLPYVGKIHGSDSMALALMDESYGRFTMDEFLAYGAHFSLPERSTLNVIRRLAKAVTKHAPGVLLPSLEESVVQQVLARAGSLVE